MSPGVRVRGLKRVVSWMNGTFSGGRCPSRGPVASCNAADKLRPATQPRKQNWRIMMSASQIGCQMYTLRDFTKTPGDLAKTLARVKKIGYQAVQMSGHGPIDPAELARMLES